MNIRRFDPAAAEPAHEGTILAAPVLPEGMSPPFQSAWGYIADGGEMDTHSHGEMELYLVFSGHGHVRVGGEQRPVQCGDAIEIPPNAPHTMIGTKGQPLLWAAFWWPVQEPPALRADRHGSRAMASVPAIVTWTCGMPDASCPGAGFEVLHEVEHARVFAGTRLAGAYNHHAQLAWHDGLFHAIWSNHPHGEDGPGQRILHATSPDARAWTAAEELFAPPGPVRPSRQQGLALTAFRWLVHEGDLYAVAGCHANVGYCDFDGTDVVEHRDAEHPSRARRGYSSLARRVSAAGAHGPVFAIDPDRPASLAVEALPHDAPDVAAAAGALAGRLARPEGLPSWDFQGKLGFPPAEDGHRLCEPTVYLAADGRYVMLLRDTRYSHRMYASISAEGVNWPAAVPTNIPDSPSLTTHVRLGDGTVLLIGNQMAPAFDNADDVTHYGRDPLTVSVSPDGCTFTRAYALRCGTHAYRVPQGDVLGRGGGAQYPSAVVQGERLFVLYSTGKEDIEISTVPLATLGLGA